MLNIMVMIIMNCDVAAAAAAAVFEQLLFCCMAFVFFSRSVLACGVMPLLSLLTQILSIILVLFPKRKLKKKMQEQNKK